MLVFHSNEISTLSFVHSYTWFYLLNRFPPWNNPLSSEENYFNSFHFLTDELCSKASRWEWSSMYKNSIYWNYLGKLTLGSCQYEKHLQIRTSIPGHGSELILLWNRRKLIYIWIPKWNVSFKKNSNPTGKISFTVNIFVTCTLGVSNRQTVVSQLH